MIKLRNKISFFILVVAALGLLSSLMHYHSYALDCLEHVGASHYTQYEIVCPVCTLHVQIDHDDPSAYFTDLEFQEYVVITDETFSLQENFDTPLGRSPPSIA